MTTDEAIAKFNTGWWKDKSAVEIVAFQLYEDRLCMPFAAFQAAVEEALGEPVTTIAFAYPEVLQRAFEKKYPRKETT